MKLRYSVWSLVFVGLFLQSVATADCDYDFMFGKTNYMVSPGDTVDVNVYLREIVTGGDTGVLDGPGGDGLFGAGVKVRFDDSPPSEPAKVLSVSDITRNSDFGFEVKSVGSGYADLSESVGLFDPFVYGVEGLPGVFSVLLGTFRFTAGSVPDEVTPISVTDYDSPNSIVTGEGDVLDGLISNGTATITTTPEPSTLALLASMALGVAAYALIRRKRAGGTP